MIQKTLIPDEFVVIGRSNQLYLFLFGWKLRSEMIFPDETIKLGSASAEVRRSACSHAHSQETSSDRSHGWQNKIEAKRSSLYRSRHNTENIDRGELGT